MEWKGRITRIGLAAAEAAAETLWPTRCALCDVPGEVLCESCRATLPYVDWWRACRRCGSPFGLVQCDACNDIVFNRMGLAGWPFASCASAVLFTGDTGQIVRVFKDQGEQRLAQVMAQIMVRFVAPDWKCDAVTFVPSTKPALNARGFDHAELLARSVAQLLRLPCEPTLARPATRDQRGLDAASRLANLSGSLDVSGPLSDCCRFLLVDDVMTTGATLSAASSALLGAGATEVRCLTFARA